MAQTNWNYFKNKGCDGTLCTHWHSWFSGGKVDRSATQ